MAALGIHRSKEKCQGLPIGYVDPINNKHNDSLHVTATVARYVNATLARCT